MPVPYPEFHEGATMRLRLQEGKYRGKAEVTSRHQGVPKTVVDVVAFDEGRRMYRCEWKGQLWGWVTDSQIKPIHPDLVRLANKKTDNPDETQPTED